jgi:uncharacterized protein YbjT (DUF2867 family)
VSATVLVTGATGFLGGALAAHLLEARADLRLIVLARAAHWHASMSPPPPASPNESRS